MRSRTKAPPAQLWRDSEGLLEIVSTKGDLTKVVRDKGFARPGSLSCELRDTSNGFIVRFPGHSSTEQDRYVCLGYDDARVLVLALSHHAAGLGFETP